MCFTTSALTIQIKSILNLYTLQQFFVPLTTQILYIYTNKLQNISQYQNENSWVYAVRMQEWDCSFHSHTDIKTNSKKKSKMQEMIEEFGEIERKIKEEKRLAKANEFLQGFEWTNVKVIKTELIGAIGAHQFAIAIVVADAPLLLLLLLLLFGVFLSGFVMHIRRDWIKSMALPLLNERMLCPKHILYSKGIFGAMCAYIFNSSTRHSMNSLYENHVHLNSPSKHVIWKQTMLLWWGLMRMVQGNI